MRTFSFRHPTALENQDNNEHKKEINGTCWQLPEKSTLMTLSKGERCSSLALRLVFLNFYFLPLGRNLLYSLFSVASHYCPRESSIWPYGTHGEIPVFMCIAENEHLKEK